MSQNRKLSRREFLRVSALVAGGALLVGCTPKDTPTAEPEVQPTTAEVEPTSEPVAEELVITALLTASGMVDALLEAQKQWMEMHPNVKFENNMIDQEQRRATELSILTNPGSPAVSMTSFGSGLTSRLVEAKAIVPLNKYYEQFNWWDFLPVGLKNHMYEGEMYQFSMAIGTAPLIFFNKTLLAQVGMEMPTNNLDELYAWSDECRKAGYEPLGMGDRDGWPGFHMCDTVALRCTKADEFAKITRMAQVEANMADYPGFTEAFQILKDMQDKGVWGKGVLDMDDEEAKAIFMNGKSVAYETGPWAIQQMRDAMGDDLDFVLFPQIKPDIPVRMMAGFYSEICLSTYVEQRIQDEVAAWWDFVLSKDIQPYVAKFDQMPIRVDMKAADIEGFADPLKGKLMDIIAGGIETSDAINEYWPAEMYALIRSTVQEVISGQKTPEAIVAEFDKMAAEIRADA